MGKSKGKTAFKPAKLIKGITKMNHIAKKLNITNKNPYLRTGKRLMNAAANAQQGKFSASYKQLKRIHQSGDAHKIFRDMKKGYKLYNKEIKGKNKKKILNKGKKFAKDWALHGGLSGMIERKLGIGDNSFISKSGKLYLESLLS